MTATKTKVPTVRAEARKIDNGTLWVLVVPECPHCEKEHKHGAGEVGLSPNEPDEYFYGMRMAHCEGASGALFYVLIRERAVR